jgi:Sec-independent protein translocase protein TatA
MDFSKNKKGQGLPLNTIVIAILVIIVLLVIIVFFTTRVGETGESIDATTENFGQCNEDNPLFTGKTNDDIKRVSVPEDDSASSELCRSQFGDDFRLAPGTQCCIK